MKKLATLLLCLLLLPSAALAKGPDPIAIYVNGRELRVEEAAPVIRHNRTFLPLRAVTEELGYTVAWNGDKKEVTLTKGDASVVMTIGKKSYRMGDKEAAMDVAPYLEHNRTFIPARYLGEATGLPVQWMPKARIVTVGSYPQKDAPASRTVDRVIFCGQLLDTSGYVEKAGKVFIDEDVVMEKACYLPVKDKDSVSFKTISEKIIQIPIRKDTVVLQDDKRYVNMETVFESQKKTVCYDEEKHLLVLGTFDRRDLAYSDITKKESLTKPDITWDWPEDGIEGVNAIQDKGRILFIFRATGEILGTIEENSKDFPKKGQLLLGAKDGNYLVATLKEKEPRKQGEVPSRRSYAIDGIMSVLTSVKM
ncbi:copper amine oxidase N-terminal domain-containing protein [Aedoeadaptatus coli]|uniref:copper amine oxidase N-terminal domain-containing protein n=1 Tax=Aedoeadaptatus coli TaxID=2058292 RepID=UPI000D560C55|nr:copper amine oxidase N-terminal domain-containing protein [Peptoniphilus coli]